MDTETDYVTASGREDGKSILYLSLKSIPQGVEPAALPNLVSIVWRYNIVDGTGFPADDVVRAQGEFEDAIDHLDENAISRLMLVVTGNGRREWHWYVRDVDDWMDRLNRALADRPSYPIEITHSTEPDWALYRNFIAGVNGL